jgi:hypothetical protein
VLADEMRCVHYDRLTSDDPSGNNRSRGSRFVNDALCSNHVGVTNVGVLLDRCRILITTK